MDIHDSRMRSQRWIWIGLIWFGFGLVDAIQTVFVMRAEGMHHAWVKLFVITVLYWLAWALATPLVLHLGHRFDLHRLDYVAGFAHESLCRQFGFSGAAGTVRAPLV
jgi:hypothetical protein